MHAWMSLKHAQTLRQEAGNEGLDVENWGPSAETEGLAPSASMSSDKGQRAACVSFAWDRVLDPALLDVRDPCEGRSSRLAKLLLLCASSGCARGDDLFSFAVDAAMTGWLTPRSFKMPGVRIVSCGSRTCIAYVQLRFAPAIPRVSGILGLRAQPVGQRAEGSARLKPALRARGRPERLPLHPCRGLFVAVGAVMPPRPRRCVSAAPVSASPRPCPLLRQPPASLTRSRKGCAWARAPWRSAHRLSSSKQPAPCAPRRKAGSAGRRVPRAPDACGRPEKCCPPRSAGR